MSKTLHGTTTVVLGGEQFTLVPTLKAVRSIEARFGGLRGAARAQADLSVDGLAAVMAAGSGYEGDLEQLAEQIWQAGVVQVAQDIDPFLTALFKPRGSDQGNAKAGKA